MTREQAKEWWTVVKAMGEGKIIQWRNPNNSDMWKDYKEREKGEGLVFYYNCEYRIKPESKYRPWKPEEAVLGILIRWKTTHEHNYLTVSHYMEEGKIGVYKKDGVKTYSYLYLFEYCEHSLDQGKTWKPCGVLEES